MTFFVSTMLHDTDADAGAVTNLPSELVLVSELSSLYKIRRFFRTGTVTQSVGCLDGNDFILVVVVVRI